MGHHVPRFRHPTIDGHVECIGCGIMKSVLDYRRNSAKKNGLMSRCRTCDNIRKNEHNKRNPDQVRKMSIKAAPTLRKVAQTVEGKSKKLYHAALTRSKQIDLQFDLTWQFIYYLFVACDMKCTRTGIKFDMTPKARGKIPLMPSLDRIEPEKGYVMGNVQLVCWFYNAAKSQNSDAETLGYFRQAVENNA